MRTYFGPKTAKKRIFWLIWPKKRIFWPKNFHLMYASKRLNTLDPALMRPGRLDRKIEFPMPDRRQKRLIFQTITSNMNLSDDVDLEDYVSRPEKISCADISAICQEAGMQAVRRNRYVILPKDFETGWKEHAKKKDRNYDFYSL